MQTFRDIKGFVEFDEADADRMRSLRPIVEPQFDAITDTFYESLEANRRTGEVFGDDRQVERLRKTFRGWLVELFSGEYETDFFEAQRAVGEAHQRLGLEPEYVLAAMNIVRRELVECFAGVDLGMPLRDAVLTVDRTLDISLGVMLHTYWGALVDAREDVGTELAVFIAHEIRNPLNAMGLNLTLLERRLAETNEDPEEYLPVLEAVRSELGRIENLTVEITEFGQPVTLTRNWHELSALIEELEATDSDLFEAEEIEFETEFDDDVRVYCDAERFRQLLVNLLKNCVEAIEGKGEVSMKAETTPKHTRLSIVDSGTGIEPDAEKKGFELFYATDGPGAGLGLPVAKKIVEGHGGSIEIQCEESEGTRVDVILPHPGESPAVRADV